jgi:hypothetical protein
MIPWRDRLPLTAGRLEREMEDLMGRFWGEGGEWMMGRYSPSINIAETDEV